MPVFKCSVCHYPFYSQIDCINHITNEHPEEAEKTCVLMQYRCPTCGRVFAHWTDCKNHAGRAHGTLKPRCEEQPVEQVPA